MAIEREQTARARIETLLDAGTFLPLDGCVDNAGVITGAGTVDARLVYVYAQYGAVNATHARKILNLYNKALTMGAPVVGYLGSEGVQLSDGIDVLGLYGEILNAMSKASGIIPQIAMIAGDCMGASSFMPACSDFVFMSDENGLWFLESAATIKNSKMTDNKAFANAKAHAKSGLAHVTAKTEAEMIAAAKELLGLLPSNNLETAPACVCDMTAKQILGSLKPAEIIAALSDSEKFVEIQSSYAPVMKIGFAPVGGSTIGFIANDGKLDSVALNKAAAFAGFCDAFNIPLVTLTDATGYELTLNNAHDTIKAGAKLAAAFASASVPKVNIITRNAFGSPFVIMNAKQLGADMVFAWAGADIGLTDPETAKTVFGIKDSEQGVGFAVDAFINPLDTKRMLVAALDALYSKRGNGFARKHATI